MELDLIGKEYLGVFRTVLVDGWFNDWIGNNNSDKAKLFRYYQESLFLNYKSVIAT